MGFKLFACSVLAVVMLTHWALVSAESTDETVNCRPNVCDTVRCRGITEEECPSPENYIDPKGGSCGCCPKCVKKSDQSSSNGAVDGVNRKSRETSNCPPDACALVFCREITDEECPRPDNIILPNGGHCGCCAVCVKKTGECPGSGDADSVNANCCQNANCPPDARSPANCKKITEDEYSHLQNCIDPKGEDCGCCSECVKKSAKSSGSGDADGVDANSCKTSNCPPDACASANCKKITEEECPPPNNYIDPKGEHCGCCPECIKKTAQCSGSGDAEGIDANSCKTANCPPDACSSANCKKITEEECPPPQNYIDPKGGDCGCCPECVKKTVEFSGNADADGVDTNSWTTVNCPPDACVSARCRKITEEECPSPQNYIDPKGGHCGCCPECVKKFGVH